MVKGYFAPSVHKAFEILKLVSSTNEGMGISEIARNLNMAKSTVHGMTSALEELGAIIRDPTTKQYTLGFTLFELGKKAYSQIDLKDLARPVMEDLMERTETSVFLGVLNGDHVTILDVVESKNDLKITSPIGTTIPLFAGAETLRRAVDDDLVWAATFCCFANHVLESFVHILTSESVLVLTSIIINKRHRYGLAPLATFYLQGRLAFPTNTGRYYCQGLSTIKVKRFLPGSRLERIPPKRAVFNFYPTAPRDYKAQKEGREHRQC